MLLKTLKNYRVSIPNAWAKELNINEDNRQMTASFDGKKIILEMIKNKEEEIMNYVAELKELEMANPLITMTRKNHTKICKHKK